MRKTFRRLVVAAIVAAPLAALAQPPIPDPVRAEPAGFLRSFLELLQKFVEGLIGGMPV